MSEELTTIPVMKKNLEKVQMLNHAIFGICDTVEDLCMLASDHLSDPADYDAMLLGIRRFVALGKSFTEAIGDLLPPAGPDLPF